MQLANSGTPVTTQVLLTRNINNVVLEMKYLSKKEKKNRKKTT